jgi:hypothetical protein
MIYLFSLLITARLTGSTAGSIIDYLLTSDAEVCKRIKSAPAVFAALKNLFGEVVRALL